MTTPSIYKFRIWFNREHRSWVLQSLDRDGNQVGDAVYVATRPEAIAERDRIIESERAAGNYVLTSRTARYNKRRLAA